MEQWWNDHLEKSEEIHTKPCSSVTSATMNLTRNFPGLSLWIHGEKPADMAQPSYAVYYMQLEPRNIVLYTSFSNSLQGGGLNKK
jgi:hypothetical protein